MATSAKPEARWFFGVNNKKDFTAYALNEYSEENMLQLHPDDMKSIAQEAVDTAKYLGLECPLYLAAMAEDPMPFVEQAFAQGLIPDYHEITLMNQAQGTDYKNNFDYLSRMKGIAQLPLQNRKLEQSPLDAFAKDAAIKLQTVLGAATDTDDIDDIEAYVTSVASSGELTDDDDNEDSEDAESDDSEADDNEEDEDDGCIEIGI